MTRTNALRVWVVAALVSAFAAAPALANYEQSSLNAGTSPAQSSDGDRGFESVNAITGPVQASDDRGYESINAVTGPVGEQPSSLASRPDRYSSPNALVGDQPAPTSLVEVRESSSGFDWGDALIGALVGTALMLVASGAARLVSQSRRRTVEA
jgi:hypothetical protein